MSYGPIQVFGPVTMASGVTTTSGMFSMTKSYSIAYLYIPTMASGYETYLKASRDGTNFFRVWEKNVTTSSVQSWAWQVKSSCSQCWVPLPAIFPYMKIEASTFLTDTVANYYIIAND